MRKANCLVFPDGKDWVVFAPASHLLMRTNEAAARRFESMVDVGSNLNSQKAEEVPPPAESFQPTNVTIVTSNLCGQECIYCYGKPAHTNGSLLEVDFCRAALQFMAVQPSARVHGLRAFFHGVGEPTFAWPVFQQCVNLVREAGRQHDMPAFVRLCTGGQVEAEKADWIAHHFNEVNVSLDGPPDIQNRQRPRRDGRDSSVGPVRLARAVLSQGKPVVIKATITQNTVHRMTEIVEFVAQEIGRVRIDFCMVFMPSHVDKSLVLPPRWQDFVQGFSETLDRGASLGVKVQHPTISYEAICSDHCIEVANHFCLAPPNIVTAFFDVPEEGGGNPQLGAYGWYDAKTRTIHFDHEKRRELEHRQSTSECQSCPCGPACLGAAGVKGRVPQDVPVLGPVCQTRIGVLKELLRRVVPRRVTMEANL